MAARTLARGMGSFFKDCEHPEARWSRCPHEYKIRYRNAAGKQAEEAGFATQGKAITRLTEIYNEKKATLRSQSKVERIQKYGTMRFEEYAEERKAGQRHLAVDSVRHLDSLLEHHLTPTLGSRRMNSFDHKVVDLFIRTMERSKTGLATQANAFDELRAILLDAHRLGIYSASQHDLRSPGLSRAAILAGRSGAAHAGAAWPNGPKPECGPGCTNSPSR
ncbi:hypothetical protein ACIPRD_08435 [Streptomyces sp. NPDC090108]|uniref:hypothetical protein n=1 Tax=Streptomyces sp. NPDC090108 TaxID=3365947 RepID=UPI00380BFA4E